MNTDALFGLVGDTPVSEQIALALENMVQQYHVQEYATKSEVEELKKKIDMLMNLVGDIPVSDQIAAAMK